MKNQIEILLSEYLALIEDAQSESKLITDELVEFVARKGFAIKSPRSTTIKYAHKDKIIELLLTLAKTSIDEEASIIAIKDLLIGCLYLFENDYDSSRKVDTKLWKHFKLLALKKPQDIKTFNLLSDRIHKRQIWMKFRELSKNDSGFKDDRRDLHGILWLNYIIKQRFVFDKSTRFMPFAVGFLAEQNIRKGELKINQYLVICHLMYFLGIGKHEESIRKLIEKYYDSAFNPSGVPYVKASSIYVPNHYPLIKSERVLWEMVMYCELDKITTPVDLSIDLEWFIVSYYRSSMVNYFKLDKPLLAKYIRQKFNIENEEDDSVIYGFESNIDLRYS